MEPLIEMNIQNLAAVPSIVYGILGLAFIVRGHRHRSGRLRRRLILTLVVLPDVIVSSREAIRAVPDSIRQGAFALGRDAVAGRLAAGAAGGDPRHRHGLDPRAVARGRRDRAAHHGRRDRVRRLRPALFGAYTALPVQIYNWTKQPDPTFQTLGPPRRYRPARDRAQHERYGDLHSQSVPQSNGE